MTVFGFKNNSRMADLKAFRKAFDQSRNRSFSDKFKKDIVRRVEKNELTVSEVAIEFEVSRTSVYKWVYKYSNLYKKGLKQVIEPMSSTKKIKDLQSRIKELEQIVGQKQIKLDYFEKLIEISESDYNIDILKKKDSKRSSGSGKIVKK
jgi:transposase-like protein